MDSYLILSRASGEFEISWWRKISSLEKKLLMITPHQLLNVGIGRGGTWFRETLEQ